LIGAIFGTGTNGAFIDRTRKISKLGEDKISEAEAKGEHAGQFMVVNTEWGAMDNGVSFGASQPLYGLTHRGRYARC
jgi:hexokinase